MKRLPLTLAVVVANACAAAPTTNSAAVDYGATSDPNEAARIAAVFEHDRKRRVAPRSRIEAIEVDGNIDARRVHKTIAKNDESVRACVESNAKAGVPSGRQVLVLAIEPNGRVSKVRFRGAIGASDVGACIKDAAKRWRFGKFPGPAATVEVPLILKAGT